MQYEELQAIWETQKERPLFVVNEFGLHMELNRTRAQARRRYFWVEIFPLFVVSPVLILLLAVPALQFFLQGPPEQIGPDELPMTVLDVLVCLVGIALVVYANWSLYASRRKNEKYQKVFAPSLRHEIELGIAQLDFEMSIVTSGLVWRASLACVLAAIILSWELGRLNDNPLPWETLLTLGTVVPVMIWLTWTWKTRNQPGVERMLKRKQALEALSTQLDENPAGSWNVADSPHSGGEPHPR